MIVKALWIIGTSLLAGTCWAQVSVDVPGYGVRVQSGKGNTAVNVGNSRAENTAGSMADGVEMEGVAVINGDVYVDGEKVPANKSSFVSKKSGKKYRITRGKDGNVGVEEN